MTGLLSRFAWPLLVVGGVSTVKASGLPPGISPADLAQIHSSRFEPLRGGLQLPLSNDPLTDVYTDKTAPTDMKSQWGKFQFLSHSRGYIHLGESPDDSRREDLYSLLTHVPSYLQVKNYDGTHLFESLVPIDSSGNRIGSFPTPPSTVQSITLYARAVVKLDGLKLNVDIRFDIHPTSDGLLLQLSNFRPVKYGIVGQVIATEGLIVQLEFFGYDKGWLVESFTMFDISNFLARLVDPAEVGSYGASIMDLLTEEVVYPLPASH